MPDHAPPLPQVWIGRTAFWLMVLTMLVTVSSIDLLLPAVPLFPEIFSTTITMSQMTVATFTFGAAIGFLLFGTLASHFNRAMLLYASYAAFGLVSLACVYVTDIYTLSVLRFLQGLLSACPGVLAPAMINTIYDEKRALRAMTLMGSIQSLAPGFAPIAGIWLLAEYGWQSSFYVVTAISLPIAAAYWLMSKRLPMGKPAVNEHGKHGQYTDILKNSLVWRYGMSRSLCLGGMVAFMLSAPAVFVNVIGLSLHDFVIVQASGIVAFFITTNLASYLDRHFSHEGLMKAGVLLATISAVLFLAFVACGGSYFWFIWLNGVLMNIGFGLAGNISFYLAIKSAKGDDTRASAIVVLWVLLAIAGGTAITAPFLQFGLLAMAMIAAVMHVAGALVFFLLKGRGSPI